MPPRKFSTLIKRMVVELDRDPTAFPDGNIVEVGGLTCSVELCDILRAFRLVATGSRSPQPTT